MKIAVIYHSYSGNTRHMAEVIAAGARAVSPDIEVKTIEVDELDEPFIIESQAVIIGGPTYYGGISWQAKKFLDWVNIDFSGKLCGVFSSQFWPGGGGADLAEINIIAAMLIRGAIIYSGGITKGQPFLHLGAVSAQAPEGLYAERCTKLGDTIARKALQLFGNRPSAA